MLRLVVAGALVSAAGANAQSVYRCTDAAGKVQLSDKACDSGAVEAARVRVRPNTLDASGEREHHLRLENDRLKRELADQKAAAAKSDARAAARERRRVTVTNCHNAGFGNVQCISR